jgi:hypothetical protein
LNIKRSITSNELEAVIKNIPATTTQHRIGTGPLLNSLIFLWNTLKLLKSFHKIEREGMLPTHFTKLVFTLTVKPHGDRITEEKTIVQFL